MPGSSHSAAMNSSGATAGVISVSSPVPGVGQRDQRRGALPHDAEAGDVGGLPSGEALRRRELLRDLGRGVVTRFAEALHQPAGERAPLPP